MHSMGTWGTKPFDNDNAADWAFELEDAESWDVVSDALRIAVEAAPSELEADQAAIAIAAGDVVARGLGRVDGPVFSDEVMPFLARVPRPSAEVVALAVSAIAVATSPEGSWRNSGRATPVGSRRTTSSSRRSPASDVVVQPRRGDGVGGEDRSMANFLLIAASSDIGAATARRLRDAGHRVITTARDTSVIEPDMILDATDFDAVDRVVSDAGSSTASRCSRARCC